MNIEITKGQKYLAFLSFPRAEEGLENSTLLSLIPYWQMTGFWPYFGRLCIYNYDLGLGFYLY